MEQQSSHNTMQGILLLSIICNCIYVKHYIIDTVQYILFYCKRGKTISKILDIHLFINYIINQSSEIGQKMIRNYVVLVCIFSIFEQGMFQQFVIFGKYCSISLIHLIYQCTIQYQHKQINVHIIQFYNNTMTLLINYTHTLHHLEGFFQQRRPVLCRSRLQCSAICS